ncbi:hypothetical protein [Pseudomonas nicosulfuronedens]
MLVDKEELFSRLYECTYGEAQKKLAQIPHLAYLAKKGDMLEQLAGLQIDILRGYFYRDIGSDESDQVFDIANAQNGSTCFVIPGVNWDSAYTRLNPNIMILPGFTTAQYIHYGDYDYHLRRIYGGRYSHLLREMELFNKCFSIGIHGFAEDSAEEALVEFDYLHKRNIKKYGHTKNHYSLDNIRMSGIGSDDGFGVVLIYDRKTQRPVRAVLYAADEFGVYFLVHGQNEELLQEHGRINMYRTGTIMLIKRFLEQGRSTKFWLGRGMTEEKLLIGANNIYVSGVMLGGLTKYYSKSISILKSRLETVVSSELSNVVSRVNWVAWGGMNLID